MASVSQARKFFGGTFKIQESEYWRASLSKLITFRCLLFGFCCSFFGLERSKMPRRKNTRKNQTSRKRPMLPEGDLDTSMSIDERKAKLDVYLKDLNMQGTAYVIS